MLDDIWQFGVEHLGVLGAVTALVLLAVVTGVVVLSLVGVAVPGSRVFVTRQSQILISPFARKRKK